MNQGPRRTPALAVLLIGCAGAATDEQPAGPPAFVVRDSAGVLIFENSDSSWTQQTAWRIEQDPTLEIGSRSGDVPGTDFGRIGPVLRFPDGRIAVGDIQALEIRVFSPEGDYLGTWARRGAGPGELQRLDRLALIGGDSLVARNDGIFRHDIFGPDGVWGRTVLAPPSSWLRGGGGAVAWLADGAFIHGPANIDQRDLHSVRQTLMGEYHLFDSVGEHSANLGRLPDRWVEKHDGVVLPTTVSYGPLARIADAGDGLWYGFPSTFELRHIGTGGVDRIVRRDWVPDAIPQHLKERYRTWFEAQHTIRSGLDPGILPEIVLLRRAEAMLRSQGSTRPQQLVFADSLPAFVEVVAAHGGGVWVRMAASVSELLASEPTNISSNRWTVFDPDGRWLGTVTAPAGLRIHEIGPDYVMGVREDELGVQYVRVHRLSRPPDR
jgi:hypothetical protein